jgi:hypothetical protein
MKLKIEINLDNAAFEDGGTDEAKRAINRALEKLRGRWPEAPVGHVIMDFNGNKVGEIEVTK